MVHLDRRALIAGAAAVTAAAAWPRPVAAQAFAVGAVRVTVLTDGHMLVGLDRLADKPADTAAFHAILAADRTTGPQHRFAVNITLLEIGTKRVLIDAGAGGTWVDTAGKLGDTLAAAGIEPKTIDHVALTHAHPDHLWGVIDDFDDTLRFPNATYSIPDREFKFWMSPTAPEAAGAAAGITAGARRILKRIEPKLARIAVGGEFWPGLTYLDAKGHTPGQCAVLASSNNSHVLVAADTLFHPIISIRHPEWQPAQDLDGAMAAATRQRLLELASAEKALVIAYHIAAPGAGRILRDGQRFRWVDAT